MTTQRTASTERAPAAVFERVLSSIQPQVCFACVGVRTVTGKASLCQDGPDVTIKIYLALIREGCSTDQEASNVKTDGDENSSNAMDLTPAGSAASICTGSTPGMMTLPGAGDTHVISGPKLSMLSAMASAP